jgi:acyl-CoA synthetase (AMP-forming)/AMP-acid ligase II
MNLVSILLGHATARPDHPALIEGERALSHAAAAGLIARYAGELARCGVVAGDRVGLALRDTADHLLLHYAVAWLGATIVPIDHRWTVPEKTSVAHAFACRCTVTESGDPATAQLNGVTFDAAWRDSSPIETAPVDDENLPVMLSLSSGTTGRPSGSLVSHCELYERWIGQWVGIGFNGMDRYLLATPLYFGAGRSFGMSFLAAGGSVIFCPPPVTSAGIIDAARAHQITAMFLVPTQIRSLLDAWHSDGTALPSVRLLVTTGSAVAPHERHQIIERLTPGFVDYYGTSEAGGISVLAAHEQIRFADTVGRPAFRVEIEIVNEAGMRLPEGEVGQLRYRGPGVSRTHVDADGGTFSSPHGWHYPGDLARYLPSGHIQLAGRAKDLIIRGGVNIYPAEIEAALRTHRAVADGCVFGRADRRLGETVVAAIVLRTGEKLDAADALDYLSERLARYKLPEHIAFVQDLPRNTSGKVVRAALIKLLEDADKAIE